ncbi:hypothetical protein ATCR1_24460 [Agrobacterium tumefaciens CCNWGS0286]|nr:hypothetical protein ATCR1_24460 [Agrobacterium tumefaciens CCNWGS0286]
MGWTTFPEEEDWVDLVQRIVSDIGIEVDVALGSGGTGLEEATEGTRAVVVGPTFQAPPFSSIVS